MFQTDTLQHMIGSWHCVQGGVVKVWYSFNDMYMIYPSMNYKNYPSHMCTKEWQNLTMISNQNWTSRINIGEYSNYRLGDNIESWALNGRIIERMVWHNRDPTIAPQSIACTVRKGESTFYWQPRQEANKTQLSPKVVEYNLLWKWDKRHLVLIQIVSK